MLGNKTTVEYKGKEYPIVFNINVLAEIQQKYGDIDTWTDLIGEYDWKAILWGFTIAINEGIDELNEDSNPKLEPLTERQVGRLITNLGTEQSVIAMSESLVNSFEETNPNE